jgi:hypothetical protein
MNKCPVCKLALDGPVSGLAAHIGTKHLDISLLKLSEITRSMKIDFHTVLKIRKNVIFVKLHPMYNDM